MKNILLITLLLILSGCKSAEGPIQDALKSSKSRISIVKKNIKNHNIQIKLSVLNSDNSFKDYGFNIDDEKYFYPASTVKLPIVLLALEKINEYEDISVKTPFKLEDDTLSTTMEDEIYKIFTISDNQANNRLFEFLGQDYINEKLDKKGFKNSRIVHRLSAPNSENLRTKNVLFYAADSILVFNSINKKAKSLKLKNTMLGRGFYNNSGEFVNKSMDFSNKNFISINDLHEMTQRLFYPDNFKEKERFNLTEDQLELVKKAMSTVPSELKNLDPDEYSDNYVKFFSRRDEKTMTKDDDLEIYNKVGTAYGQLTETALIISKNNTIILTATMTVNENQYLNDDKYEYDSIGIPFFSTLSREILNLILTGIYEVN
jgi:beta-lactamase class A